ncbi:MAG: hypothetical protein ACTSYA_10230 [Candidatus Kariarchaeaceae archaeon]
MFPLTVKWSANLEEPITVFHLIDLQTACTNAVIYDYFPSGVSSHTFPGTLAFQGVNITSFPNGVYRVILSIRGVSDENHKKLSVDYYGANFIVNSSGEFIELDYSGDWDSNKFFSPFSILFLLFSFLILLPINTRSFNSKS